MRSRALFLCLSISLLLAVPATGCGRAGSGTFPADAERGHADSSAPDGNPDGSVGVCNDGPRPQLPAGLVATLVGNAADSCVHATEPGLLLMGGGADVDAAFSGRIKPRLSGGDVVVLRSAGTDAYNSYLFGLLAADSVETIIVDTADKANSDYVEWAVRTAEFVWFSGGDQSDYLNKWQGTKLEAAVKYVRSTGGLIGGTSAGLAILGDVIYDPDNVSAVISSEAVLDPCGPSMLFSDHFLEIPATQNMILEPHFHERDRMGRLLSFMARIGGPAQLTPHRSSISAIAIDQATSMFVDGTGHGIVDGAAAVYVIRDDAGTQRTTVQCGRPIVYQGVRRTKLTAGGTYDLPTGQSSATAITIGIDGRTSTFYSPADPY